MSKFRRSPTRVQWVMICLLLIALAALVGFAFPEVAGILSEASEDTFSEWVWDLPLPAVLSISMVFLIVGAIAIGAVWHFIEGYVRRRKIEKGTYHEAPPKAPPHDRSSYDDSG